MKNRSPLITVAIALVGILIVSIGLIALGQKESRTYPSAQSYRPSGSSAFAELLRESGYKVVIDQYSKPHLQAGEVVVAFVPTAPTGTSVITSEADDDQVKLTKDTIADFVSKGGKLLSLPFDPDFVSESHRLYDAQQTVTFSGNAGVTANVSWDETAQDGFYLEKGESTAIQIWGTVTKDPNNPQPISKTPFVSEKTVGKGKEVNLANGIVATNRFIDRQQNALVLLNAVRVLDSGKPTIVFAEASFGAANDPGVLGVIGPWAVAAWFQLIFLGIIVVYTLGKPFGYPDPERRQERGARDLMDAMADTLRRGRMTGIAFKAVINDTNRMLRKLYRGRRDLDRLEMQAGGLNDLNRALTKLEAAAEIGAPENVASKMIQDVERLAHEASARTPNAY